MSAAKQPAHKIRIGYVTATIWANTGNGVTFYAVEVQRSYKAEDGNIGNTNSLGHADLLNAIKVLERAEQWIADQA